MWLQHNHNHSSFACQFRLRTRGAGAAHPSESSLLCISRRSPATPNPSSLLPPLPVGPHRSAEAASWGAAAQQLWANAGPGFQGAALPEVLGDEAALTGKGQHGRGVVVSLLTRRLLLVFGGSGAPVKQ